MTKEESTKESTNVKTSRKLREGIVVSAKMEKTAVVQVTYKKQHPVYKKTMGKSKKFKAQNENNDAQEGDKVQIMETRPLSKTKRWRVFKIIERAK